ncbi:MAG: protein kinase domain-containing protein [Candidatus Rifleibacteriota bacterium]
MFEKDQIIGRHYKVISQLGEGGMGLVYKALDVNLGREVAIKFLLPDIAKDEDIVKRFLNEGRVMATINHPAVISVYASDVEESNGVPFLVMEYVDGKSLDKIKDRLRTDTPELLKHFIQLMSGMNSCHNKEIIHRDLKPENLLINKQGQLKIVDFGIAKSASKHTKTGMALGTPHYMSPEQCLGKQDITAKTDVYAAGIMLYEILTGSLPFKIDGHVDDPALTIALKHLNDQADFSEFDKVPMGNDFRPLIERMIAKKPEDRPGVPEIIRELNKISKLLDDSEKPTVAHAAVQSGGENMIGEIYRIQAELGSGGMGKVYKALDTALNRSVAIKVLHDSTAKDKSVVDRFIQEGQVLATVGHRNVMGIYASSIDKRTGRPFLVMEYIEGRSLSKLKDALRKDKSQIVPIMLQLAEGLDACHERGIIHRDLKPGNIIINNAGLVKILDFGIAKTEANLTKTGMTVGTPEYMSPEQCTGSKNLTSSSDIYSLGIIFWEMLFGKVPFKADANTNPELSVALKHIEATLPVQQALPDMSLVKIISLTRKMLDKDPSARPDTDYIIDCLEEYLEEHQPEALPRKSSARHSTKRSSESVSNFVQSAEQQQNKSNKSKILAAVIIIILVAGGVFYYSSIRKKAKPKVNYEKTIKAKIDANEFDDAQKLIEEYRQTEEGKAKASFLQVSLSNAMIGKADQLASKLEYKEAIDLYAKAIVLNPANPKAAMNLTKLQQDFEKVAAKKARIEELKTNANSLIAGLEPGSGTALLSDNIDELKQLGLATFATQLVARWQTRFIASGSSFINDQPEKALQYFTELKQNFPELEGVESLIERARNKNEELKTELADAQKLDSLKSALSAAIDNYTGDQEIEFILKQINKVEELGEKKQAENLKQKLAEKIKNEGEKLIVNEPGKALALFENAKNTWPGLEGLETSMQLASESLSTLRSSEEMKAERDELANEISKDIAQIEPPQDIAPIQAKLKELARYADSSKKVRSLRNTLFEKYFNAVTTELKKSPQTAKQILDYCYEINPEAPGIKEIAKNIEKKIQEEEARRKAAEEKERAERLKVAKNSIYTGIKKDPIPEDMDKIAAEISALWREYPDSEAPEKLMQHLQDRVKEEIEASVPVDITKAENTIDTAKVVFAHDPDFLTYLSDKKDHIEQQKQVEARKRAAAPLINQIESFIKSPDENKLGNIRKALEKLETEVSKTEATKYRRKVSKNLTDYFENSSNPDQAFKRHRMLVALTPDSAGSTQSAVNKLSSEKVESAIKLISNFEPKTNISPVTNKLGIFNTWNQTDKKTQALNELKNNYIEKINRQNDPKVAYGLLKTLQKIPEFTNDSELVKYENRLQKLVEQNKSEQVTGNLLNNAEEIIAQNQIYERADELFDTQVFLKDNAPDKVDAFNGKIVNALLKNGNQHLASKDFTRAEQAVRLAKQFSPGSDAAQRLQVQIAQAKKAASTPQEFVVGPGQKYKSINQAIKAAPNGMTIKIKPGNYNEKVYVNKPVIIVGESVSACRLNCNNGPTITITANAVVKNLMLSNSSKKSFPTIAISSGNSEISECMLSNSTPATRPNYTEIIAVSGGSPVIKSNQLNKSKGMGITVTGGSPVISHNNIEACQIYGIWFNGRSKAQVSENTIKNNGKSGVGVKNHASPSFRSNLIANNGENGMLIYANASGNYEGNRLSNNNYSGIEVWDAQPQSIKNNIFDKNNRDGIYIRGNKAVVKLGKNRFTNTRGENVRNSGGKIVSM